MESYYCIATTNAARKGSKELKEKSKTILENHPINEIRIDQKENPGNMIWLWGQGTQPSLPTFKERWNLTGSVISAVDLVNGILLPLL